MRGAVAQALARPVVEPAHRLIHPIPKVIAFINDNHLLSMSPVMLSIPDTWNGLDRDLRLNENTEFTAQEIYMRSFRPAVLFGARAVL